MPKKAFFFLKKAIKSPQHRGLHPQIPIGSGGRGLCPQIPCCYLA